MELSGKVVLVTGGAAGIGAALCRAFAKAGAQHVYVADRAPADDIAREVRGTALRCDVRDEAQLRAAVQRAESEQGRLDVLCSNAGVAVGGGVDASDEDWRLALDVNLMAHVWGARAALPGMLARGSGYLVQTASAAGLLSSPFAAPYTASKHAAVGLAEWLAYTYGHRGIRVSCVCPLGVRTNMVFAGEDDPATRAVLATAPVLEATQVADATLQAMRDERFLVLPHAQVQGFVEGKVRDRERWLAGMRKLQQKLEK